MDVEKYASMDGVPDGDCVLAKRPNSLEAAPSLQDDDLWPDRTSVGSGARVVSTWVFDEWVPSVAEVS